MTRIGRVMLGLRSKKLDIDHTNMHVTGIEMETMTKEEFNSIKIIPKFSRIDLKRKRSPSLKHE